MQVRWPNPYMVGPILDRPQSYRTQPNVDKLTKGGQVNEPLEKCFS